jgi:ribose 5-phosphate isomerase B
MKIALTTDHAGFEATKRLETFLTAQGHECVNFGPAEFDPADDYPDFIFPAARAIAAGECELGIIMGGSGQGEAMVANRVKGIRAAVYYGPVTTMGVIDAEGTHAEDQFEIIRLSKEHNNANVLSLAARFLNQADTQAAVTLWLATPFSGIERHRRRIAKIDEGA